MLPFSLGDEFGYEVVFVTPGALEEKEEFFEVFGGVGGVGGLSAELRWEEGTCEEGFYPRGHVPGVGIGWFRRDGEAIEEGEFVIREEVGVWWETGVKV